MTEMTEAERLERINALEGQIRELRALQPRPAWADWLLDHHPDLGASWGLEAERGEIYQALRVPGMGMGGSIYAIELRHPRALAAHRAVVALLEAIERGEIERP
jgi:hypothetical protein